MFELEHLVSLPARLETSATATLNSFILVDQDAGGGHNTMADNSNYSEVNVTNSASAWESHDTYVDISFES